MPLNDKDLHPSSTLGQENNGFPLLSEPLLLPEEASPPFSDQIL